MKKEKRKLQVDAKEAMELVDYICHTMGKNYDSMMGNKLIKLLFARIYHMKNCLFETYFDKKELIYKEQNVYGEDGPNYFETIDCCEEGWNWVRYTGPNSAEEINRSEFFKWECSLFMDAYSMYRAVSLENLDYERLMGEDRMENLPESFCSCEDYTDNFFEEDESGDAISEEEYILLVACGACYINSRLTGSAFPPEYEKDMERMYLRRHCISIITAREYFDSFFDSYNYINMDKECMQKIYPYLLDVICAMKYDAEECCTPTLYIYTSDVMKQYKDLRDSYAGSRYVPYLDKLLLFLEDPVAIEQLRKSETLFETDVLDMLYSEHYSVRSEYTDTCFLAVYYFYETGEAEERIRFNPFFMAARQLFEILFEEMKQERKAVA